MGYSRFARRKGEAWFLAVVNGTEPRTISIPLSFLPEGDWHAMSARDATAEGAVIGIESSSLSAQATLTVDLQAGGGWLGRLQK